MELKENSMLEKWAGEVDRYNDLVDFVRFLNKKGIDLQYVESDQITILSDLLYEYIEVDPKQLEKERRELLEEQQKAVSRIW